MTPWGDDDDVVSLGAKPGSTVFGKDDAIVDQFGDKDAVVTRNPDASIAGEFWRGLIGGFVEQNPEMAANALEAYRRTTGLPSESAEEWLREIAGGDAKQYKPAVGSLGDIRREAPLADFARFLAAGTGAGVASTIPSLVLGAAGVLGGGAAAGPPGAVVGGIAGALVPSLALNTGDIYGSLVDEGVDRDTAAQAAIGLSIPVSVLDLAGIAKIAGIGEKVIRKGMLKILASRIKEGTIGESWTEAAQQAIQESAAGYLTGKPDLERRALNVLGAGLIGGAVGSGISTATGAAEAERARRMVPREGAPPAAEPPPRAAAPGDQPPDDRQEPSQPAGGAGLPQPRAAVQVMVDGWDEPETGRILDLYRGEDGRPGARIVDAEGNPIYDGPLENIEILPVVSRLPEGEQAGTPVQPTGLDTSGVSVQPVSDVAQVEPGEAAAGPAPGTPAGGPAPAVVPAVEPSEAKKETVAARKAAAGGETSPTQTKPTPAPTYAGATIVERVDGVDVRVSDELHARLYRYAKSRDPAEAKALLRDFGPWMMQDPQAGLTFKSVEDLNAAADDMAEDVADAARQAKGRGQATTEIEPYVEPDKLPEYWKRASRAGAPAAPKEIAAARQYAAGYGAPATQKTILVRARRAFPSMKDRLTVRKEGRSWALHLKDATPKEHELIQRTVERETNAAVRRSETARKRGAPKQKDYGLLGVIARGGGIADTGGELKAMDLDRWHVGKPGMPKLVHPAGARGQASMIGGGTDRVKDADYWGETLIEDGYLPPQPVDAPGYDQANAVLELIARAAGGEDVFPVYGDMSGVEDVKSADARREAMERLAGEMGIDTTKMDDETLAVEIAERLATREVDDATESAVRGNAVELEGEIPGFEQVEKADVVEPQARPDEGKAAGPSREEPEAPPRGPPAGGEIGAGPSRLGAGGKEAAGAVERTEAGDQRVIPGAERISRREQADRAVAAPLRSKAPQAAPDEGIFDVAGRGQMDLVEQSRQPSEAQDAADEAGVPDNLRDRFISGWNDAKRGMKFTPQVDSNPGRNAYQAGHLAYKARGKDRRAPFSPGVALTEKATESLSDLAREMDRIGKQMFGQRFNVAAAPELGGALGRTVPRPGAAPLVLIAARRPGDPSALTTLGHEGVHYLRAIGALAGKDWRLLESEAAAWKERFDIAARYSDLKEEGQTEEAVSDAFGAYVGGERFTPEIDTIFDRIRRFLTRVWNALNARGFRTIDDLFQSIEAGALADIADRLAEGDVAQREAFLQVAMHVSPYDFDAFSLDHIGTGEGHQTFGWGLYFLTSEAVKRYYQRTLADKRLETDAKLKELRGTLYRLLRADDDFGFDYTRDAVKAIRDHADWQQRWEASKPEELQAAFDAYEFRRKELAKTKLYTVDLAPKEDEYLDWDKPLSEQSDKVLAALEKMGAALALRRYREITQKMEEIASRSFKEHAQHLEWTAAWDKLNDERKSLGILRGDLSTSGGSRYKSLALKRAGEYPGATKGYNPPPEFNPERDASIALRDAGIPGIRYLDQGSRGTGSGTHNYVIFDDSLIKITGKEMRRRADNEDRLSANAGGAERVQGYFNSVADAIARIWKGTPADPRIIVERPVAVADLTLWRKVLFTPLSALRRFPGFQRVILEGEALVQKRHQYTDRFFKQYAKATKGLSINDLADVQEALWLGDSLERELTPDELRQGIEDRDGDTLKLNEPAIKAFQDVRRVVHLAGRLVDQHERAMLPNVRAERDRALAEIERINRSARVMTDPAFKKAYTRRGYLQRKVRRGAGDQAALLGEIDAINDNLAAIRSEDPEVQDRLDRVRAAYDVAESRLSRSRVTTRAGYMPHKFIGSWRVFEITGYNDDGAPIYKEHTSDQGFYDTRAAAIKAANDLQTANPDALLRVERKGISWPSNLKGTELSDAAYGRLTSMIEDATSLEGPELQEAMQGIARRPTARRFATFKRERTGYKGWAEDMTKVLKLHLAQVAGYVTMDKLKYDYVKMMEREGLSKHKRVSQDRPVLQAMMENWFRDVNGEKQNIERYIDNWLMDKHAGGMAMAMGALGFTAGGGVINPVFGVALGGYLGLRMYQTMTHPTEFKLRQFQDMMVSDMAHLKLGAFTNVGSAIVNLMQISLNAYPKLGHKYTGIGIKRGTSALFDLARGKDSRDARLLRKAGIQTNPSISEMHRDLLEEDPWYKKASMFFFNTTEHTNRAVTFMGAYQRALDRKSTTTDPFGRSLRGDAAAFEIARVMVSRTQFDDTLTNRPELLRAAAMRLPGQFKNFVAQQIAFFMGLRDMTPMRPGSTETRYGAYNPRAWATPEVARFLLAMSLTSGMLGLPFLMMFDWLLDYLFDFSPISEMKKLAIRYGGEGLLGGTVGQVLLHGAPALFGLDLSQRSGMGAGFFPSRPNDFLGPWFGTAKDMQEKVKDHANTGDLLRTLSPGIGAPVQALEAAANGMGAGKLITDPSAFLDALGKPGMAVTNPLMKGQTEYRPTPADIAKRATGMRPLREAMSADVRDAIARTIDKAQDAVRPYLRDIADAIRAGKGEDIGQIVMKARGKGVIITTRHIQELSRGVALERNERMLKRVPRTQRPEAIELQQKAREQIGR